MSGIATVSELLDGIRKGRVARRVRLFAAQGLLPVSREDLLRLQVTLTTDPDQELASQARRSVREVPEAQLVEWLQAQELEPFELDLVARLREEESAWAAVARHRRVSDDTLRLLARYGSPLVQDVVVTNQVRLLGCLDLLDDLRANQAASQVVLRRVREFEEEFIDKALTGQLPDSPAHGPRLEDDLEQLRGIGGRLPAEEEFPPLHSEEIPDPDAGEAVEDEVRRTPRYLQLMGMNTHEKIMAALKGSKEDRTVLINSRSRLVARSVLASPKLTDLEVERFAGQRTLTDEVIRIIAAHPRWTRRYGVIHALAANPKTPVRIAMSFLSRLSIRDLKLMSKDRNVSSPVRQQADRLVQSRR